MKKFNSSIIVIALIFTMLFSFSTLGAEIKDVPESHWAYDSVNLLIEKGYLSLYEDGTFKGTNKVSRYELAEIIARLLEDVAAGDTEMSEEDMEKLRELSLDFRDELVEIANKQNTFSKNLNQVQKKNVIQDEEIGKANKKITKVQEEVSQIIDEIATISELKNRVDKLNNKVTTLEEDLSTTNQKLTEKDQKIEDLRTEIKGTDIQKLKDKNSALESKVNTLQGRLQELQQNVNENSDQLTKMTSEEEESQIDANKTTLYLGAAVVLALLLGS